MVFRSRTWKTKSYCKICGGSGLYTIKLKVSVNPVEVHCFDSRPRKIRCLECKGTGVCIHNRRKTQCKECVIGNLYSQTRKKIKNVILGCIL
jgi:hypothetical protein